MINVVEVRLWGTLIGAVSYDSEKRYASFQYSNQFLSSGIELSPIMMPLAKKVYRFPQLSYDTFHGLPGMLADSLPDRYGNILIEQWLMKQGREMSSFSPLERLCYTGVRGMGALEYEPAFSTGENSSEPIAIAEMVELASQILQNREDFQLSTGLDQLDSVVPQIFQVGTSAGGARAKAVIAYHPETGEVRSGQVKAPVGYEYWLMKFDGVSANKDKELADPQGYTVIEYVYSQLAKKAGIVMAPCRLLRENGRSHFLTKRFDRQENGQKIHMQTLGAIAHLDYNMPGMYSYEQAFSIMRQLNLSAKDRAQLYRRMVFNILSRNQDDHVKNISFLMNRMGRWSLSPAYDVTYSYQPAGLWTGSHQMSLNGKRMDFAYRDLLEIVPLVEISQRKAKGIIDEVAGALSCWAKIASDEDVPPQRIQAIERTFRLGIIPN